MQLASSSLDVHQRRGVQRDRPAGAGSERSARPVLLTSSSPAVEPTASSVPLAA